MKRFQRKYSYRRPKEGSILIATVWILVFFSILSVGIATVVSSQIRLFKKMQELVLSDSIARSICLYVQKERSLDDTPHDTLQELQEEREKQFGIGKALFSMTDEAAKININTAPPEVLAKVPGINLELATKIAQSSRRPYAVIEELFLIEGMDEKVFEQSREFLTTYSDGTVNVNTAPKEVLEAIGMDEYLANGIIDFRKGLDGQADTSDDGFFESDQGILDSLNSASSLSEPQKTMMQNLINNKLLSVGSKSITMSIQTYVLKRPAIQYHIVMTQGQIRRWSEQ